MSAATQSAERVIRTCTREATFQPATFDAEAGTVDIVWSTGARVRRVPWWGDPYDEELSMAPGAVRLGRLNSGTAPFLRVHRGRDTEDVLGVIVEGSARVADGKGTATVRFSQRDSVKPIVQDIRDRILRNVSVGYDIHRYETYSSPGQLDLIRIVDWEPIEVSVVPIGADPDAHFRGMTSHDKEPRMERPTLPVPVEPAAPTPTAAPPSAPAAAPAGDVRAEPTVDLEAVRRQAAMEARAAERQRLSTVMDAARKLRLNPEDPEVLDLIGRDVHIDECRAKLIDLAARRDDQAPVSAPHRADIRVGAEEHDTRAEAMVTAILHRANPSRHKLTDAARQYHNFRLLDFCAEALRIHTGEDLRGRCDPRTIAKRALRLRAGAGQTRSGYHTTADFPLMLGDAMGRSLRGAYEEHPKTYEPFTRVALAPDFRPVRRIAMSVAPNLVHKPEGGEVSYGTFSETGETYALATYARAVALTREAIVNDDLSAFDRIPRMFGGAAARLEADLTWGIITGNPNMADGIPLFHADHGNLTVPGGAPSIATLADGLTVMGLQTDPSGALLNMQARFVLCPTGQRAIWDQILGERQPAAVTDRTPSYMQTLTVIAEPRLHVDSTARWYLAADPAQVDTIERLYLQGVEGLFIETDESFDVDGVKVKCTLDYATKAIDHRGLYRNGA